MKRFRVESGLALAVVSKEASEPHGLIHLQAPVDWKKMSTEFDRLLAGRSPSGVVLKAVVAQDSVTGLRKWLADRRVSLSGERTLGAGESREVMFHQATGRFAIENSAPTSVAPMKPIASPEPARPSAPASPEKPVTVLVVDDSKAMRMVLRKILESSPRFKVIGEAALPSEALKFLEKEKPDVMTLDIQMPEMSGVELFKKISLKHRIPAVMVSALGMNEGHEVMDALEAGAFDYFQKPDGNEIQAQAPILHEKLLQAAISARRRAKSAKPNGGSKLGTVAPSRTLISKSIGTASLVNMDILAIGSSTGGTEAVRCIFEALPADIPPTVVVQHIPPFFSAAFAERLNKLCKFEVREARDGDELRRGLALIAPGGLHLEVVRSGRGFVARVTEAPPVNRFRPSVDVLFKSVVKEFAKDASRVTGIILTGMGNDGAQGLLDLRKAGARTIGQDEESSVVYGMPRAAAELGACEEVAALEDMALLLTRERKITRAG